MKKIMNRIKTPMHAQKSNGCAYNAKLSAACIVPANKATQPSPPCMRCVVLPYILIHAGEWLHGRSAHRAICTVCTARCALSALRSVHCTVCTAPNALRSVQGPRAVD